MVPWLGGLVHRCQNCYRRIRHLSAVHWRMNSCRGSERLTIWALLAECWLLDLSRRFSDASERYYFWHCRRLRFGFWFSSETRIIICCSQDVSRVGPAVVYKRRSFCSCLKLRTISKSYFEEKLLLSVIKYWLFKLIFILAYEVGLAR